MNPGTGGVINDALARDQTTAPCLLPQASRVPAARCAGWRQARAPGPSSTTTHRRQGRRGRRMLLFDGPRQHDGPRVRGAAPAQTLASSRRDRPGPQHRAKPPDLDPQPCAMRSSASFAPNRRATSLSLDRLRATPPQRAASANKTGRLASETRVRFTHDMTHASTTALSTPATPRPPRAGGGAPATRRQARPGEVQDEGCAPTSAVSAGIRA